MNKTRSNNLPSTRERERIKGHLADEVQFHTALTANRSVALTRTKEISNYGKIRKLCGDEKEKKNPGTSKSQSTKHRVAHMILRRCFRFDIFISLLVPPEVFLLLPSTFYFVFTSSINFTRPVCLSKAVYAEKYRETKTLFSEAALCVVGGTITTTSEAKNETI
jgi:hypothetical protein